MRPRHADIASGRIRWAGFIPSVFGAADFSKVASAIVTTVSIYVVYKTDVTPANVKCEGNAVGKRHL